MTAGVKRPKAFKTQPVLELEGKMVPAKGDALDRFLASMDDPNYWRTIPGRGSQGEDVILSPEELDLIRRIQEGEYGDAKYNPYEPYVDFFTGTVLMGTVRNATTEPKSRSLPSRWERIKVQKLVAAIRQGRIKLVPTDNENSTEKVEIETAYDMWAGETDASILARRARHIEAPKLPLPHHRESYRPPIEYLLSPEEQEAWEAQDPEDRPFDFLPQRYAALRLLPGWGERAIRDRFSRCLDLYLCPRGIRNRIQLEHPDDLLPTLPDPQELRPFPTTRSVDFVGHQPGDMAALAVDPTGRWLLSATVAGNVRLWDTQTGHCQQQWNFSGSIGSLAWNPNTQLFCFAIAVEGALSIIVPPGLAASDDAIVAVKGLLATKEQTVADANVDENGEKQKPAELKSVIAWKIKSKVDKEGIVCTIQHPSPISKVVWHYRGDYFASLCPDSPSGPLALLVHQLSSRCTQSPFRKLPRPLRTVAFHPTRPYLALATSKSVRLYDLSRRELLKRLVAGVDSISALSIHAGSGDNLVISSHDGKLAWFDLDYSTRPYRTLSSHRGAARAIDLHPTYPLMASVGDDGVIQVVHVTVYAELSSDPLIVPVKSIKEFVTPGTAIQQVVFHPTQPWLFAAASNGSIALFV